MAAVRTWYRVGYNSQQARYLVIRWQDNGVRKHGRRVGPEYPTKEAAKAAADTLQRERQQGGE